MPSFRLWLVVACCALVACASESAVSSTDLESLDDAVLVEEGKADDFLSLSTSEFVVSGTETVRLEASYAQGTESARLARVEQLIAAKQIAYAYFLTSYLVAKEPEDKNYGFGGFSGLAKVGNYTHDSVTRVDNVTYTYAFSQVIAGPNDLLAKLPTRRQSGKTYFTLTIGTPSNDELMQLETDKQWFRNEPWKDWNPPRLPAERKMDVQLQIAPAPRSDDAWFDYDALFADDLLTIDLHFGYDYHSDYHRKHARSVFMWLKNEVGFRAPVSTFDAMTNTNNTFTKSVRVDGRNARIEVRIFYPKTGANTDPNTPSGGRVLENDLRRSLRTADVIAWNGHSGPFYGFALANWKSTSAGDFSYEEISQAEMPENRYQIVFADGCDTYHLGQAFANNPAKPDGQFIDIITSTTLADGDKPYTAMNFIDHLIQSDDRGNHRPQTLSQLLMDLRRAVWNDAMYGVHGVDDNPQLHPYAEIETMCKPCRGSNDCGDGSLCTAQPNGQRACTPACTTDDACGQGNRCAPIASRSARTIYANACVPRAGACGR